MYDIYFVWALNRFKQEFFLLVADGNVDPFLLLLRVVNKSSGNIVIWCAFSLLAFLSKFFSVQYTERKKIFCICIFMRWLFYDFS